MNLIQIKGNQRRKLVCSARFASTALAFGIAAVGFGQIKPAVPMAKVSQPMLPAIQHSQLTGHLAPSTKIYLTLSFKAPNVNAIESFVDSVSNPHSTSYQHFITPAQFGARFGQSSATMTAAVNYLKSRGFKVTLVAQNNLSIMFEGTSGQAESAFNTTIDTFHSPYLNEAGRRDFYANVTPIQLPTAFAGLTSSITGISNYAKPKPMVSLTPNQTHTLYNTLPILNSNLLGQGRTIAISNFDGFRLSNVPILISQYGLPTPPGGAGSNISVETIGGGSGSGSPAGEGDLDIQMVISNAPLCKFIIYDGTDLVSTLTLEAQDNTADIISESYGWVPSPNGIDDNAAHTLQLQMASQGITYMHATGDSGTSITPYDYPDIDPSPLGVGGTIASIDSNNRRTNEVAWGGSGGGWATDGSSYNKRPSWQVGHGVPTNINYRLQPDVALQASGGDGGAYWYVFNGTLVNDADGTSFASPVWAGCLGVTEQRMIQRGAINPSNGKFRLGRIQDLIYSQNGRSDVWYDVTSGSTGTLPDGSTASAGPGWDFTTGWGAVDFYAFANSISVQSGGNTINPSAVSIYMNQGQNPSGTLSNLFTVDGNAYSVQAKQLGIGQTASVEVDFPFNGDPTAVVSATINLTAKCSTNCSGFVYAYNQVSKQWDLLTTNAFKRGYVSSQITINNPTNYISSSGGIKLVFRGVSPSRFGSGAYTLSFDQAVISYVSTN